ncbi:cytochrome ubiquinol oxidase subunit I [Stackebrandtia nassauensis]|uniref:Cytochrome bd ubiquinol oxidase subunit I n=1 Tax=Stackebrandtia nassauensis (strain DSM 44728 / CIP 108903 / NRRL B-16338 / NBRC 102104 / LLR-40K-21) TaxID=446470 RepID=D3Q9C2_STANL|nr:cytochrome ubiquinol oxidase subunit I [Stackebrandtia nassauensis]ADD42604.1 cytochrome bd ubiquinol oxidase subunit I [Stackebrandtia nassauensis DSM 44728]
MTAVDVARLQFAVTTSIHWMFVLVTLGLVVVLVTLQTRAALTRNPVKRALHFRMTRYWGLIYVINYSVGIASGIIMEFQFGTNWSGLSHLVGDVFGAPLAVETLVAFVAESTFLALWIFGWGKLPVWIHTLLIWLVAASAYASAFWVLVANGFMQNPTGFELTDDGRANLTSAAALFNNPSTIWAFVHILGAALTAGGVILVVVSAAHLFRRKEKDFFTRSFRLGYLMGLFGMIWAFGTGWAQYGFVNQIQPAKELGKGLGVEPAFHIMMLTAELATPIMLLLSPIVIWKLPAKLWFFMPLFWLALPFPFAAAIAGWVFREMGRQPWIVYGVQKTEDAVSDIGVTTLWTSFWLFTVLLGLLLLTNWWLITRHAVRGPNREIFGIEPDAGYGKPAAAPAPVLEGANRG